MSRISVRGFAVASATAVTTVGAVVGVAAGGTPAADDNNFEAAAADTTLLADIPAGQQAQVQTASLTQQAAHALLVTALELRFGVQGRGHGEGLLVEQGSHP
ncbi:hypothetical protein ACWECC_10700, partial [Streptomyces microflavus]